MWPKKSRDLVALIIDIGPSMRQLSSDGETTVMDLAKKCLSRVIETKIFCQSKNEYILIALGADETLIGEPTGYPNILKMSELGVANLKLLKTIKSLEPTDIHANLFQALCYASDLLVTIPNPQIKYGARKIGLFTNFSFTLLEAEAQTFVDNYVLPRKIFTSVICNYNKNNLAEKTDIFSSQSALIKLLQYLGNNGAIFTFDFAIENMGYLEPLEQSAAPWHTRIWVGKDLFFQVTGYIKTTEHKKRTWSRAYIEPQGAAQSDTKPDDQEADESEETPQSSIPVSRDVNYLNSEKSKIEIEKEEIAKAYLYGKTIVPITPEIEEAMKFKTDTTPAVRVLFWTDDENARIFFFTGSRSMIFIPDIKAKDNSASAAFSVLAHSMMNAKKVAIVSLQRTSRSNPQIGCLTSCFLGKSMVLVYNQLPFAEDIRHYQFPPLIDEQTRPQDIPSNTDLDIIDDLIELMSLVERKDNKITFEHLNCEQVQDPHDRIQFKAIVHKYFEPINPLPEEILKDEILVTPPTVLKRCEAVVQNIKKNFKLVERSKRSIESSNTIEETPSTPKKLKTESKEVIDIAISESLPVELECSFEVKDNAKVDQNDEEMIKFEQEIEELSKDLLGLNDDKIIECLEAYRKKCIEDRRPAMFNKFMVQYKPMISNRETWKMIIEKGLTLISNEECDSSEVSSNEVKQFIIDCEF